MTISTLERKEPDKPAPTGVVLESLYSCCGIAVLSNLPYGEDLSKDAPKRYNPLTYQWEPQPHPWEDQLREAINLARAGGHGGFYGQYPKGLLLATTSDSQLGAEELLAAAGFSMVCEFRNPAHVPFRQVKTWLLDLTKGASVPTPTPDKVPVVAAAAAQGVL